MNLNLKNRKKNKNVLNEYLIYYRITTNNHDYDGNIVLTGEQIIEKKIIILDCIKNHIEKNNIERKIKVIIIKNIIKLNVD